MKRASRTAIGAARFATLLIAVAGSTHAAARDVIVVCGPGNPNDCFSAGGPPGCSDQACCELVCASDPFCCETSWDEICAGEALALCTGCPSPSCEGAAPEGEAFGVQVNPGCSAPSGASTPIACGQSICGTLWHTAGSEGDDRDSYLFAVTPHARLVTFTVESENVVLLELRRASDCWPPFEPASLETDGCVTTLSACLPPGEYAIEVRGGSASPSGTEDDYRVDFICADSPCEPAGCGNPTSGSCFDWHPTAHCDDALCCETVCQVDKWCCWGTWDQYCAAAAWCLCAPGEAPTHDACADAIPIAEGIHVASTCGASTDGPPTDACGDFSGGDLFRDVWFRYTPSASGLATIATCGSNFAEVVAIYEGCACLTLAEPIGCAYRPCPPEEIFCVPVDGSQCYLIRIGGLSAFDAGETVLSITLDAACDIAPVCPNPTHDCYSHGSVGCSDETCCELVCAVSPYCCDVAWDCVCIEEAKLLCGGSHCAPLAPPRGAILEPEACGADLNGGCVPPATVPAATPIACGDVLFGSAWASDAGSDRDVYVFDLAVPSTVRFAVQAEFPGSIALSPYGCMNTAFGFERIGGCQERTAVACLAPGTYLARVLPFPMQNPCGSAAGNDYIARLTCEPACLAAPANDDCGAAIPVGDGRTPFTNEFATTDGPTLPPQCSDGVLDQILFNDVWFEYESDTDGVLIVELLNATIEGRVFVYEKVACDDLPLHVVACSEESCVGDTLATAPIACGARYLIRVGGTNYFSGGTGEIEVSSEGAGCAVEGDLNGDGLVNAADLAMLLGQWGAAGSADLSGDGSVGAEDLAILLGSWS